jgi:glycosyltransferase involved in cell wall biosynthesis
MNAICFVGADVYPVLNPEGGAAYIGGESVQHTLLARAFRDLGWRVSVVDTDRGQPDGEVIDGIQVFKTFRPEAGIPAARFLHPRLTGIWAALRRADADVYYQSCAGMMTGVVAAFRRRFGRTFLFRTAHDTDCIPGQQLIRFRRDRIIYEYGLRRADAIAVQGVHQRDLLRRHYGLEGAPIHMAVELPSASADTERDIDVLWVNNLRPFKRPELAVALARRLNRREMTMIGGPCPGMGRYYDSVRRSAEDAPGLAFRGPVPYRQVNGFFHRARLFVNTSESEGFPNSFLQAWIRGVPVVSFFDPDGLIARHGLGAVPADLDAMAAAVERFLDNPAEREAAGERARRFARETYGPEAVARQYLRLLRGAGS